MLRFILLLLITIALPLPAMGESPSEVFWTHSLYFENDLFIGTDSDYTNGVKYSIISPDLSPKSIPKRSETFSRMLLDLFHRVPLIRNAPAETGHKVEIALGQLMFTPRDTSRYDLIRDDRPYAGYSYLATAFHRKSDSGRQWSQMDTAEVQFGMVGPASLAEQAQKFVHRVRGLQRPNGWDHQLKDEPGLLLAFERKWLYHPVFRSRFGIDGILHSGAALGNIMTYLNAGLELRLGINIPRSFSVSIIRPAGSTWSTALSGYSLYLFSAVNGRAVLRDIFLDGNSFRSSHHVDKKPLVADLSAGLTARWQRLSLSLAYTQRTREFEGQPKHHGFGSIMLRYAY